MAGPDRLAKLLAQTKVAGLDFVYVWPNQTQLDVFFLGDPAGLDKPLLNDVKKQQVRITASSAGEPLPDVAVDGVAWAVNDARDVLRVTAAAPGGFSPYRLFVDDTRIDPHTNGLPFSFKAGCDSALDCREPEHECPPESPVDFPVDYLARDFWSFRRALLDYASQRYPQWDERLEADVGVMLAEAMSALGDELAYTQDRIAREAHLETATQRRSLRRHARLVDYELDDGHAATTWLRLTAVAKQSGVVPAGRHAGTPSGAVPPVEFEVGRGVRRPNETFAVDASLDALSPHVWDENETCLPAGSTELYVDGKHAALLPEGKWVMLETSPADVSIEARAWPVRLTLAEDAQDPVLGTAAGPAPITRLVWEEAQATPFELDLESLLVHGNLAPATAGTTRAARFTAGTLPSQGAGDDPALRPPTVERVGPNATVTHLFSLTGTGDEGLAWRDDAGGTSLPEVRLWELEWKKGAWSRLREWLFESSLLNAPRASRRFTLDDGQWRRVVGFPRIGGEVVHRDYADGRGATVRFGDGEFGLAPAEGTVFEVEYRTGGLHAANVAAGSLTRHDMATTLVAAVTNPRPATNGRDPEPAAQVRRLAPEAFRQLTFRAVRPEDYAEAAERLDWVQQAGATFRWTGSWLTAFVTPDPRDAVTLAASRRDELENWLDRFRQAGRDTVVSDPVFADVDLEIAVCVEPFAYRGEVEERVLEALFGRRGVRPARGFFDPDEFTFGTPLERSRLETAIQRVPGVRAVEEMSVRRRGWHDWRDFAELLYDVGPHELLRVANDRMHPERGSVKLDMRGGA